MSITSKSLLNRADSLANEYNMAVNGADRDKIKAEWYREVSRVSELIETHNTFSEKKLKSKSKIKKVFSKHSKHRILNK